MDPISIVLVVMIVAVALVAMSQYQRAERVKQRSSRYLEEANGLREKQDSLRTEITDLRKERDKLSQSVTGQKKRSRGENKRGDDLKGKLNTLKQDNDALREQLKDRQEVVAELRDRMDDLEGQLAAADSNILGSRKVEAVVKAPVESESSPDVDDSAEKVEATVDNTAVPSDKALLDAKLEVEKYTRRAQKLDELLRKQTVASSTANLRFRETMKKLQRAERESRRTLRQEADHRRMLSVITDRFEAAVELLHNLEVQHGVKVPDPFTGNVRRLKLEEVVEYEAEQAPGGRGAPRNRQKGSEAPKSSGNVGEVLAEQSADAKKAAVAPSAPAESVADTTAATEQTPVVEAVIEQAAVSEAVTEQKPVAEVAVQTPAVEGEKAAEEQG